MIAPLFIYSVAIHHVYSQTLLTPNCNYAATAAHYYPIGVCVRRTDGSFKYTCSVQGSVRKSEWDGDNCDGTPSTMYNVAGGSSPELEGFECNLGPCTYSEQCDLEGCAPDCSDCLADPDSFNRVCLPFIEDTCTGNVGGLLVKDRCVNGGNTASFYFGGRCTRQNLLWQEATVDGACVNNRSYEVTCDIVAPPGPKGAKAGKGASALASEVVMDVGNDHVHRNRYTLDLNKHYNLFGFKASLLDLILISSNAVFIMICLCFVGAKCRGKKTNGKYVRANDEEYEDEVSESKAFFNNDL